MDASLLTADISTGGATGSEGNNDTASDERGAGPGFGGLNVRMRATHHRHTPFLQAPV